MKIRFKLIFICIAITYHSFALGQEYSDIRIISSDQSGVTIEYFPHFKEIDSLDMDFQKFFHIDFDGSIVQQDVLPGAPILRFRSVLLEFPSESNNYVKVLDADFIDIQSILLQPKPHLYQWGDALQAKYFINSELYQNKIFLPEQIVALKNIAEVRGTVLGNLEIYPYQYNPGLRILRMYKRIKIYVAYGNNTVARDVQDKMVRGIALNSRRVETITSNSARKLKGRRSSVLATGTWFQIPITEDGIYKLTGSFLLNAGIPGTTDPSTIQIYNNGGFELPYDITISVISDLQENAVYIHDVGRPDQLDVDDYILFYGKGTRGWRYNSSTRSYTHYINRFSETNIYWLTYGQKQAKRMQEITFPNISEPFRVTSVEGKVFREDEKINILGSGLEWLGQSLSSGESIQYDHQLFNLDFTQPIVYRFHIGGRSSAPSTFVVKEHSDIILTKNIYPTVIDGYDYRQFVDDGPRSTSINTISRMPSFSEPWSRLRFTYTTTSASGVGYINWYEIFYKQHLRAQENMFAFHTYDTTTIAEYCISGFTEYPLFVFDVSSFSEVQVGKVSQLVGDTCVFQMALTSLNPKEIVVISESRMKTPLNIIRVNVNQDLHGDTTEANYVIITPKEFLPAAQKLKAHRERVGKDFLKTLIVDVDHIYNEFGGGIPNPVSIRNYLYYLDIYADTFGYVQPSYVLLLGDGHFDYRGIITRERNWIPTWQTNESFIPIRSFVSDDYFVIFNTEERVEMGIGRLTARSLSEANAMVDKIIEYETRPQIDPWKMRVTFVADDGLAGAGENDRFTHTNQADLISRMVSPLFETRKIYLFEYPTVSTAMGRRKPAVNEAIRNQIDEGTVLLNFTGHGNPRLWTHEAVFVRESDFPLLKNRGKYFFLIAATCNFSAFDLIGVQSGGELLVELLNAGAVATFSATRAVFATQNFVLNQTVYRNIFQTDSYGRIPRQRLGDIVFRTKQERTTDNDRKYILIGDPALRLAFPEMLASIDSINRRPTRDTIQISALSKVTLLSSVVDSNFIVDQSFNGRAYVVVYDADRTVTINDPTSGTYSYKRAGDVLFRGENSIVNGKCRSDFIVPKDISYSNDFGRITLYFWNQLNDGAGYTNLIRIWGTDTSVTDQQGPKIRLYLENRNFLPGDIVGRNPLLIVELEDEHGINTSSAGIGHRIEAWIDDVAESIDLTQYYKCEIDMYTKGTIEYRLNDLQEGGHRLRLRAWDTYNNATTAETFFNVVSGNGLNILSVFNYPNPFSTSTEFIINHNQTVSIDAEVKIFTVSGRLIQILKNSNVSGQVIRIPWDGRDKDGDFVANGVYLFKVILKTTDRRFSVESLGKLMVLK